jgi:hypothetical protein
VQYKVEHQKWDRRFVFGLEAFPVSLHVGDQGSNSSRVFVISEEREFRDSKFLIRMENYCTKKKKMKKSEKCTRAALEGYG